MLLLMEMNVEHGGKKRENICLVVGVLPYLVWVRCIHTHQKLTEASELTELSFQSKAELN